MKLTVNKTNVTPAGGSYPYGNIKNDDGTFNGTPINVELLADYVQFFEKIFADSGIVSNGLADNETNDFQLVEAMEAMIEKRFKLNYYNDDVVFIADNLTNISSFFYVFNIFNRGTSEFDFQNDDTTINIVSFGRNNSPVGTVHNIVFDQSPNGAFTFNITLNSTNAGSNPVIKKAGIAGADTTFTIPIGETFQVIRLTNHWEILAYN